MNKELTEGELLLLNSGFELSKTESVIISESLKYTTYEYARYMDEQKTGVEMSISFNPSQDSIDIHNNYSTTVFLTPSIVHAVYIRAREIGFVFPEKPSVPEERGKNVLMAIMNMPKPNLERRKREADELENRIFGAEYNEKL